MEKLETALDDLDGLWEAYRALSDDARRGSFRRDPDGLRSLQREIAAAADAYGATLVASARGDVTTKRIAKCRKDAQARMKGALARQQELASLVNQRRLPAERSRDDVKQLVTLSLRCRAGVAALTASPAVDTKAAEALANKVLVALREATLLYLASARDSGDADGVKPRAAVVGWLEKTGGHAAELAKLEQDAAQRSETSKNDPAKELNALLHKTVRDWALGAGQSDA